MKTNESENNSVTTNNEIKISKKGSRGVVKEILQWIEAIVFAVVIALLIRAFVFEPVLVQGESMENTLYNNQRLIVYKLGYMFNHPQRGDIVVLQYEEGISYYLPFLKYIPFIQKAIPTIEEVDYIKRVVGVPGDTISFKDGALYINGKKQNEDYAKGITEEYYSDDITYPAKVPENKLFVLGDNREASKDSRIIGFIDYRKIKGKAALRIWPIESIGSLYR